MLSDNIRKYRKANNLSQDELAEKLGITRQSVSLWETGQTQPSLDSIVALARIFHVSTDALLTDQESAPVVENTESAPIAPQKKKTSAAIIIAIFMIVAAVLLVAVWLVIDNLPKPEEKDKPDVTTSTTMPEAPEDDTEPPTTTEPEATEEDKTPGGSASEPTNPTSPSNPPEANVQNLYDYLKSFVIENGIINGDYCYYSKSANNYGGYTSENFSLYYWGDTDTVEFSLHSVLDDTFSICFYLRIPKTYSGKYEYISSYYFRDTGEPLLEARGTITASEFTQNYPLNCSKYIGSADQQNDFMEMSRKGICDLLSCLKEFTKVEKLDYSFADFGFKKY